MKFIIQRADEAAVSVDDKTIGSIQKGYMVLIGIGQGDDEKTADKLIHKLVNLRLFSDSDGKTNLNLSQVNGELLLISQFTLYANCKKGNRPSFTDAADPDTATALYEYIISKTKDMGFHVETGTFGEHMSVTLTNNGPFTVILDSKELM